MFLFFIENDSDIRKIFPLPDPPSLCVGLDCEAEVRLLDVHTEHAAQRTRGRVASCVNMRV